MTPRGRYRSALEKHLRETRDHATASRRGAASCRAAATCSARSSASAQDAVGQMLALAKAPLDIVRGSGGEEKVLKNAKDACATEALEIATYIALEHVARAARRRRRPPSSRPRSAPTRRRCSRRIQRELPTLADAVVRADIGGEGSYDIADTGVADAVRDAAEETQRAARSTARRARSAAPPARHGACPVRPQAEGAARGAVASEAGSADRRLRLAHRRRDRRSGCRGSRRSTSRRSRSTSARRTTARPCSTGSPRCAATSRGPATTR